MTTTHSTDDLVAALLGGTRPGAGREVVVPPDPTSTRGTPEGSDPTGGRQTLIGVTVPGSGRMLWVAAWMIERYGAEGAAELTLAAKNDLRAREGDMALLHPEVVKPPLWILRKPNGKPNYASTAEMERFLVESGQVSQANGETSQKFKPERWEDWIMRQGDKRRVPPRGYGHDGKPLPEGEPIVRLAEVKVTRKEAHLTLARRTFGNTPEKARAMRERERQFKQRREARPAPQPVVKPTVELVRDISPPRPPGKHGRSKLTQEQVVALYRRNLDGEPITQIAREWEAFGYRSWESARESLRRWFRIIDNQAQKEAA